MVHLHHHTKGRAFCLLATPLTGAQHQQVVTAVGYRDRQAMVPDLRIHGLEGRGPSYYELKLLRASRNTYPSGVRGGATGVEKLALTVNREHIGRLTDLDEQLYGVAAGPRQHGHSTRPPNPGPLVRAYDTLGTVRPIVFGYLAEASAGACDLIKSVADELAPRYADLYLLDSVEAAVGIATDQLREEIGAAVFKAQARVILGRIRYCYRGNRAADARRHLQQRGGAAGRSTHAPTAAHGAATPSSTGARSRPGLPGGAVLVARLRPPAPRPRGRGIAATPSRYARSGRQYPHRATM